MFSFTTIIILNIIAFGEGNIIYRNNTEESEDFGNFFDTHHVKPDIKNAQPHNYFRRVGFLITEAAYAQMDIELDISVIHKRITQTCSCAVNRLNDNPTIAEVRLVTEIKTTCMEIHRDYMNLRMIIEATSEEAEEDKYKYPHFSGNHDDSDVFGRDERSVTVAVAITSAITGLIGGAGIAQLFGKNDYDDSEIRARLGDNDVKLKAIDSTMRNFEEAIRKTRIRITDNQEQLYRIEEKQLCAASVFSRKIEVDRIFNAIHALHQGTLHPRLMDPNALKGHLERINAEAKKRGYASLTNKPSDLFRLPVTFKKFKNSIRIQASIQIPLIRPASVMTIHEFVPTPLPLTMENSTTNSIASFHFIPEKRFLARNQRLGHHRELENLEHCTNYNSIYICKYHNVAEKDNSQSCLEALYVANKDRTIKYCDWKVTHKINSPIQLDENTFHLYSPEKTRIEIECPHQFANLNMAKSLNGSILITVPDGCTAETNRFLMSALSRFGTYGHCVAIPNNLPAINKHIAQNETERLKKLEQDDLETLNLKELNSAMEVHTTWIPHQNKLSFILSLVVTGLVVFTGTIGLVLYVFTKTGNKINHIEPAVHMTTTTDEPKVIIHPTAPSTKPPKYQEKNPDRLSYLN